VQSPDDGAGVSVTVTVGVGSGSEADGSGVGVLVSDGVGSGVGVSADGSRLNPETPDEVVNAAVDADAEGAPSEQAKKSRQTVSGHDAPSRRREPRARRRP